MVKKNGDRSSWGILIKVKGIIVIVSETDQKRASCSHECSGGEIVRRCDDVGKERPGFKQTEFEVNLSGIWFHLNELLFF